MTSVLALDTDLHPVDWGLVDKTIFDWARDRLGIKVIWEQENRAQPAYPYLSMLRAPEVDEGGADELRYRTLDIDDKVVGEDPTAGDPVVNEEIACQSVQFIVTIQAHVDFANGATDPNCDSRKLISKLKRSLGLTSVNDAFSAANVALVEALDAVPLSAVENAEWVSRTALDVIFRTVSIATDRVGFIDKVQLKSDQLGVDFIVDASS